MIALLTHYYFYNIKRELLTPCCLTGKYEEWGGESRIYTVQVALSDGRIIWADPANLRHTDGEPIEDIRRELARADAAIASFEAPTETT